MTAYAPIILETANVPESHKRGLEQNRETRAAMYVRHLNRVGVDIAVNQETGTYLQREIAKRPRWESAYPPPNDHIKERTAGNGQNHLRTITVVDRTFIPVARTVAKVRTGPPLNQSVTTYRVTTETGDAEFVVIGVHLQAVRDDPTGRSRRRVTTAVYNYSRQLDRAGVPHIIAGDTNSGANWDRTFKHLKPAARHKVDTVLVSRTIKAGPMKVHTLPKVSDHAFVTVELSVPITNPKE